MSERCFEPDPLLVVRVDADRVVLVPLGRSDAVEDNLWVLEGPAARAWTWLAAGLTLGKVSERLRAAYEVSADTLAPDLTAFVEALVERRILRERQV